MCSRSRKAYRNGLKLPRSKPYAPMPTKCDAIRFSYEMSTRMIRAFSGTFSPHNFSTASA